MTNSTGLNWRPPEYYSNPDNLIYDDIRLAFELDVISEPGRVFSYKPDPQILVYSLSHLSGEDFIKYVDANLFRPMGIVDYQWDPGFNTIEDLRLTARDTNWVYICAMERGRQDDYSNDYIAESTMPQIWADYPEQEISATYGGSVNCMEIKYITPVDWRAVFICHTPYDMI